MGPPPPPPTRDYVITVHTGNKEDSQTNDWIVATIHGEKATISQTLDRAHHDDFQRNKWDSFTVSTTKDLGAIRSVELAQKPKKKGEGYNDWYLESVFVELNGDELCAWGRGGETAAWFGDTKTKTKRRVLKCD